MTPASIVVTVFAGVAPPSGTSYFSSSLPRPSGRDWNSGSTHSERCAGGSRNRSLRVFRFSCAFCAGVTAKA